jgi:hypothetical protein
VIVEAQASAGSRELRVELLANRQVVELRFPSYSYTQLKLVPGERIRLSLRKAALATVRSTQ